MSIKDYIKQYCKENNITYERFLKDVNLTNRQVNYESLSLNKLCIIYKKIGDNPLLNNAISFRIKSKFKRMSLNGFDIDNINTEDCMRIFNILTKYKKEN